MTAQHRPDPRLTVAAIRARTAFVPRLALILGSGLGGLAQAIVPETVLPYAELPGFPVPTVPSHAGKLVLGQLEGVPVAAFQGRFHAYEGHPLSLLALPVQVAKLLGATSLIVTNAAGALVEEFFPGDVMLIEDHINFLGGNPLAGPNDDALGPRFPDMSRAYAPALRRLAEAKAAELDIGLRKGVYAAIFGPSLETSAERRFLRLAGAQAVGMSTVPEVIAANHCGLYVLGFSAITNKATGGPDQQPDTLEEVLANAAKAGEKLSRLLSAVIPAMESRAP